jgi:uncharacterized protein (TIGR02246 family)
MKRIVFALAFALTLTVSLLAQASNSKAQSSVEQEIMKLEKEWFDAYLRSDVETVNRIEADDFVVISRTSGAIGAKQSQLTNIRNRTEETKKRLAATTRTLDQVKIRTYGDVVIVNGISVSTRRDDAGANQVVVKASYTGVWVKRDGRWRIVNSQFTDIPEQKPQGGN